MFHCIFYKCKITFLVSLNKSFLFLLFYELVLKFSSISFLVSLNKSFLFLLFYELVLKFSSVSMDMWDNNESFFVLWKKIKECSVLYISDIFVKPPS